MGLPRHHTASTGTPPSPQPPETPVGDPLRGAHYALAWCLEFYATTHGTQYAEVLRGSDPGAVSCVLYTASLIATPQQKAVLQLFRTLLTRAGIDVTTEENRYALVHAKRVTYTLALPLHTVQDMDAHGDAIGSSVLHLMLLVNDSSWRRRAHQLKPTQ